MAAPAGVRDAAPATQKRQWSGWTPEEDKAFLAALKEAAKGTTCAPAKVLPSVVSAVQTKDYGQVRDRYYRCIKQVNHLLVHADPPREPLDAAKHAEMSAAVVAFLQCQSLGWTTRRLVRSATADAIVVSAIELAVDRKRQQVAEAAATSVGDAEKKEARPAKRARKARRGAPASPDEQGKEHPDAAAGPTPAPAPAPDSGAAFDAVTPTNVAPAPACAGSAPGARLALKLRPGNAATAAAMEQVGLHPRLQLNGVRPRRTLRTVVTHLREKWASALGPGAQLWLAAGGVELAEEAAATTLAEALGRAEVDVAYTFVPPPAGPAPPAQPLRDDGRFAPTLFGASPAPPVLAPPPPAADGFGLPPPDGLPPDGLTAMFGPEPTLAGLGSLLGGL